MAAGSGMLECELKNWRGKGLKLHVKLLPLLSVCMRVVWMNRSFIIFIVIIIFL